MGVLRGVSDGTITLTRDSHIEQHCEMPLLCSSRLHWDVVDLAETFPGSEIHVGTGRICKRCC